MEASVENSWLQYWQLDHEVVVCELSVVFFILFFVYVLAEIYCLLVRVKLTRQTRKACPMFWDGNCSARFHQNSLRKKTHLIHRLTTSKQGDWTQANLSLNFQQR